MTTQYTKEAQRQKRHRRVRAKVVGTAERPRVAVYKSNTRLIAQVIDDARAHTLAGVTSSAIAGKTPRERVEGAARTLADMLQKQGVTKVVFDRGGFNYTGTIKAFADALRAAGMTF